MKLLHVYQAPIEEGDTGGGTPPPALCVSDDDYNAFKTALGADTSQNPAEVGISEDGIISILNQLGLICWQLPANPNDPVLTNLTPAGWTVACGQLQAFMSAAGLAYGDARAIFAYLNGLKRP